MTRKVQDAVVVITGASSGIGRATARAFAARRARVVLAARREAALDDVARECERAGGRALVVPTDVTELEAVEHLASRAVDAFGRIDVWVNNAAVAVFGRFEDTPYDAFRRVIDVNLLGYVHGARAALPRLRRAGGGVLINNASILARLTQPYMSAYVMSKHAIQALSDCLRQELVGSGIEVCTALPAAIDTPLWQHSANYTGHVVEPPPPVYPPERVARTIVSLAERPRRVAYAGNAGRVLSWQHLLAPGLSERVIGAVMDRVTIRDDQAPVSDGNIFMPLADGHGAGGGWSEGASLLRAMRRLANRVLRGDQPREGEPTRLATGR
ncbi:SDR family oxidoreductase [Sandaracinus amylolyticus]|nr:SDR family oxidoreductase [Sandaracinus amylolyticus]